MNNNLKEFKQCILNYEAIDEHTIKNTDSYNITMGSANEEWFSEKIMNELTGFGNINCILCKGINMTENVPTLNECDKCTWVKKTEYQCFSGSNADTYSNFYDLKIADEDELVNACKKRADYMRSIIDWYEEKQITIKFKEK